MLKRPRQDSPQQEEGIAVGIIIIIVIAIEIIIVLVLELVPVVLVVPIIITITGTTTTATIIIIITISCCAVHRKESQSPVGRLLLIAAADVPNGLLRRIIGDACHPLLLPSPPPPPILLLLPLFLSVRCTVMYDVYVCGACM